jgi:MYXO-CTERM domain-containing protein
MHRHPVLLAASVVPLLLACLVGLGASPAAACSPPASERQYYTFGESLPADGATGIPLDGAVVLTSRAWSIAGDSSEFWRTFESFLTVTVQDTETGETVPGTLKPWLGPSAGIAWTPERPLSSQRRYALVATLDQTAARPAHAEGPTELRMTFTTGSQVAEPLELLGGLEVDLERQEVDRYDCSVNSCCEKDGTERAVHARVRVPGLRGGTLGLYHVALWVTDRTPFRFDVPPSTQGHEVSWGVWGVDSGGASTETFFRMPKHEDIYAPCFSWQVTDPAGHTVEGPPLCLNEGVEPASGGGLLGCAVGPGASGGTVGLLLLVGLAVSLHSRRRRGA